MSRSIEVLVLIQPFAAIAVTALQINDITNSVTVSVVTMLLPSLTVKLRRVAVTKLIEAVFIRVIRPGSLSHGGGREGGAGLPHK